jgi:UDP-N-acetylmuramoyl-L-alanyl-D-glutamate--2,6-diaminopimelate ligase
MRLSQLISGLAETDWSGPDIEVKGLASDSRKVSPGDVFFALAGTNVDGQKFIADALGRGAVAVVTGSKAASDATQAQPILNVAEPRLALANMAARFFDRQPETIVAVTGTSGKTSVADFTRQLLAASHLRAASIGTIGIIKPGGADYGSLTTPDPIALHRSLKTMADEGVTHLAMEASSHGLDQYRLDGVRLKAAAFTNLGRDHLDYHPDMEAYFTAKMRLFRELLPNDGTAVINMDDAVSSQVVEIADDRRLSTIKVGKKGRDIELRSVTRDGFHQVLDLVIAGAAETVCLPLVGNYQVSNALVAAGLAMAVGLPATDIASHMQALNGVKGRLEIAGQANGGLVVVDYAHKPEALQAALDACRPFVSGRLIVVFGCGGDRDKGKRPLMGKIAADGADVVIVTDDNPRTENAKAVRQDIIGSLPDLIEIGDRRQAIHRALEMMGQGDVVIVAGKGHETGQIIGDQVLPFSDHEEISQALGKSN